MELLSVTLAGFRRFAEPAELRTSGKLVALLGPNEAGKTSILKAISQIGSTEAIPKGDLARAAKVGAKDVVISARFRLDVDDLAAASIDKPTCYVLDKSAAGNQTHRFEPQVRKREISHRQKLRATLERVRGNNRLWGRLVSSGSDVADLFNGAEEVLSSAEETLSIDQIEKLELLRAVAREEPLDSDPGYFKDLSTNLFDAIELEQEHTPSDYAFSETYKRIPKFLLFSNEDRLLKGSYTLDELNAMIPPALSNIARVAGLDIVELISAINEEDTPKIAKLKLQANEELRKIFSENWSQSKVQVAFEVMNEEIQILVQEDGFNFTKLAERSDGLRQFVALQAFTTCERAENPVLLIDEAEMRLHYDAQADLIQMLSRQTVSPKIIYTTHSAGCLPEDLGNGVRLVDYVSRGEGAPTSTVRNHFWNRESGGLEPLLFGMGAATLAFFPIRRALLTEGESDMLLLPTMFRECFDSASLDFQIVPGLSKTSGINLPILARNGKGIAFILDGDQGGREIKRKILEASFDERSVFFLKASGKVDSQLEDFIDPKLLSIAAHDVLSELAPAKQQIAPSSLRATGRLQAIATHYGLKKPGEIPKTRMAYSILDYLISNPDRKVVDPQKKQIFEQIAHNIRAHLAS